MPAELLSKEQFQQRRELNASSKFHVLDGYVKLVDLMGMEQDIAAAARVTANTEAKLPEEDIGLIRYLMRHRHTTPLEMVEMKFEVMVAMDTWRQWVRHRMATINEYSTRYSPAIDEAQTTSEDMWRMQSVSNRQGSSGEIVAAWPDNFRVFSVDECGQPFCGEKFGVAYNPDNDNKRWGVFEFESPETAEALDFEKSMLLHIHEGMRDELTVGKFLTADEDQFLKDARELYERRLKFGVAKEQARKDLPLSTMTKVIWKIDLHNLLHFLSLRMDGHAQFEIRSYANAVGKIVSELYPVVWEAFEQYRLNAMTLTSLDIDMVNKMLVGITPFVQKQIAEKKPHSYLAPYPIELFMACLPDQWQGLKNRERDESLAKLQKLGLVQKE